MKKLLKILFSFFILSFFLIPQAKAADLNIDCPASPVVCSKSGLDPLFSNSLDGYWYPGKSITKTLNLKNSDSQTREMGIKGTRTSTINILENVMHISIVSGTTVIWSGSAGEFYGQDKIGMGTFSSGANLNYDFTVFMSSSADDNYQNKETIFDLTLGFWSASGDGEIAASPSPMPLVLGATSFGEASPSAGTEELVSGLVQGRSSWPKWLLALPLPVVIFFFLKWLQKHRRMN